jgi:galactokinase/galacturonokinase
MHKITLAELRARVREKMGETGLTLGAGAGWVIAPYRINPLGAHVDHQGGAVLGRTIDQYTVMAFHSQLEQPQIVLETVNPEWKTATARFPIGRQESDARWVRYAQAAAGALHAYRPLAHGMQGTVSGSLVGAGLSSSASVILTYLLALATVNKLSLTRLQLVELTRQVENEYLGLDNGIQDQTAISYGRRQALAHMDTRAQIVTAVSDHPAVQEVCWLLVYSGFSRELLSSGFNNRVAECRQAARLLMPGTQIMGDLPEEMQDEKMWGALPAPLQRRARHFFGETARVKQGCEAWSRGEWSVFGRLMNASCHSSITQYESGSPPLVALHRNVSIDLKQQNQ